MFACQECGQRAAFGDEGCPDCGSSDIDLAPVRPEPTVFVLDGQELPDWHAFAKAIARKFRPT